MFLTISIQLSLLYIPINSTGTALASDTIQFVDVEAIKKGTGIQNHDKETPLKPLILQPRLSTPRSSTKGYVIVQWLPIRFVLQLK